jgi:hypothetical protein
VAVIALKPGRGVLFFGISVLVLITKILVVSLTRTLAEYSMPIIAIIFLLASPGLTGSREHGSCRLWYSCLPGPPHDRSIDGLYA